jgi:hypothetical protein
MQNAFQNVDACHYPNLLTGHNTHSSQKYIAMNDPGRKQIIWSSGHEIGTLCHLYDVFHSLYSVQRMKQRHTSKDYSTFFVTVTIEWMDSV